MHLANRTSAFSVRRFLPSAALLVTASAQTFGPPITTIHPIYGARWMTFADLDRDGRPDLIAVDASFPQGRLAYAIANGPGTFGTLSLLPTLFAAVHVVSADLDLDGNVDLVVSNPSGQTAVHYGEANGQLGSAQQITGVFRPMVLDVNGDIFPDLVGTSPNNLLELRILFGTGHRGSFTLGPTFQLANAAVNLAAVDVDGDGRPEFVSFFANAAGSSYQLLRRTGPNTFLLDPPVQVWNDAAIFGGVADFDEDGREDLIIGVGHTVQWFRSNGSGFEPGITVATASANLYVKAITDFDGDGHLDLLCGQQNDIPLSIRGHGDGSFGGWTNQPDLTISLVAFVDVTGDGVPDYVGLDGNVIEVRSQLGVVQPGTLPYGVGSPSCTGVITIGLDSAPQVGNLGMRVRCANVPRGALGLVFGGGAQNVPGYLLPLGVLLHTEEVNSITLGSGPVDASGTFGVPMPIPNNPAVRGITAFVQGVFLANRRDGALCGGSPFGIVSSLGLSVTAQ